LGGSRNLKEKEMYKCPLCKAEYKTEEELKKHFAENEKCRAIAWMYRCCVGLKIRFAREG